MSEPPSVSEKRVTVAGTLSKIRRVREAPAARSPSAIGSAVVVPTAPAPTNTRRPSESMEALSAVPGPVLVIVRSTKYWLPCGPLPAMAPVSLGVVADWGTNWPFQSVAFVQRTFRRPMALTKCPRSHRRKKPGIAAVCKSVCTGELSAGSKL